MAGFLQGNHIRAGRISLGFDGVGIGLSTVAAPMYIAEIAPPAHRGRLARMFQLNIVFGIVVAFLSNAPLAGIGDDASVLPAPRTSALRVRVAIEDAAGMPQAVSVNLYTSL